MSPDAQPTQTIVIQEKKESMFGRFGKVLIAVVVILVIALMGLSAQYQSYFSEPGGPQEKYHSLSKTATDKIAIISVTGTIIEGDDFAKKQIDLVRKDDSVRGLVLRINSPGGTVTYSDYLLHHLRELREAKGDSFPVVVSMGSLCASGGYYIAMAVGDEEDVIFAEPTTWTGSIGVVIPHYNLVGLMQEYGVEEDSITSGKFKRMGSPTREMSPEERELFQELVDETYEDFLDIVRSGRPKFREDDAALKDVAQGQIFTATQAVDNGLVDKIGFIEAAIERTCELAGVSTSSVRCVEYKKQLTPFDALMNAQAASQSQGPLGELRAFFDLTTPRAYYLYTTLPAMIQR
ncbi:putative signal peptide peptidase SppA [Posidoniimonas corsicana]|uniref:Putative signal peptide peptidase SppA n=1 Tax=Posidoniimonas corsicana TaxID=1938618 RepID=A0A5C5V3E7_9BACT|nr:signal peptide peptidase SppA [Posidoniimonas corsicana]TWT32473.1 putative signal peptide peptidase SppA [Posidoniimonas corsicana]